jgi:hypothetical protein
MFVFARITGAIDAGVFDLFFPFVFYGFALDALAMYVRAQPSENTHVLIRNTDQAKRAMRYPRPSE